MMGTCGTKTSLEEAMTRLEELSINFLALDFDCTILSIHTGGRWQGSPGELLPHVRPIFRELIQAAVHKNIQVAIVTYTPQVGMVRTVLEDIVGHDAAERIPIRGNDRSWQYTGSGSKDGKQAHMASAVEEILSHHPGMTFAKNTTLLIDDDPKNIRHALKDGTRAVWLNPDKADNLFKDIVSLV